MNIENELSFIEDQHFHTYSNKYSCNSCIDLAIALIKHQSKFHSKVHASQTDLLELLQNALIPNNNGTFDYNITVSVIKIPIHDRLKCEPELEEDDNTTTFSNHVSYDWLKQEPDTILNERTKSESSDDDSESDKSSVTAKKYTKNKSKVQFKKKTTGTGRHPTYTCDICSTSFSVKRLLIRHLKNEHIPKQIKPNKSLRRKCDQYKCIECNEIFPKLMFYRSHLRLIHPEKMIMRQKEKDENLVNLCDICGRGFEKINSLNCHRKTHEKSRPFICSICSKAFSSEIHLNEHMNIHIGKKIKCMHENCDREYSHQSGMTRHYKVSHTLNQDYKCEYCPKRFSVFTKLT